METSATILITAANEAATIGRAITSLLADAAAIDAEIIVVTPDEETKRAAEVYKNVKTLRDPGKGKPAALNLGFRHAGNNIVVMTDGDVYASKGALMNLVAPFEDENTGIVSGRPVSLNPRDTMLGYWSHLLTDAGAHAEREIRSLQRKFFVCSGYLYAVRLDLIDYSIPEDALAEDAVVSHLIGKRGYKTRYAPEAKVYVKYPTTYKDWLKQKVRSAGGYAQPIIANSPLRMRSFRHEALYGSMRALRYASSLRELWWTLLLFAARLHLWLLIFWRVQVRGIPLTQLWQRVESTK